MGSAFVVYLVIKGLKKLIKVDAFSIMIIGALAYVTVYFIVTFYVVRKSVEMENRKMSVYPLFVIPMILKRPCCPSPTGPTMWPMPLGRWRPLSQLLKVAISPLKSPSPYG